MPFFTIVTATYNAAATLPRLLESLVEQTCRDFELIIQDGASKDDTVAVAESYRDRLPFLSLASEPDTGIYDAWNKALPRIRGEWVLFLGGDDALAAPQVLESAKALLSTFPSSVLFGVGGLAFIDNGRIQQVITVDCAKAFTQLERSFGMPLPHPALFTRQHVIMNNAFDSSYKISGDYDFLCRTWRAPHEARALHLLVTRMGLGGISNSTATIRLGQKEIRCCARNYFPRRWDTLHRYCFFMTESYLYPAKMHLKGILQRSAWGRKVWECLKAWRKKV